MIVSEGASADGSSRIPIRNLWLLRLYAEQPVDASPLHRSGVDENPDEIPLLVADLFVRAMRDRLGRSLNPGYVAARTVSSIPRGRIDLVTTLSRGLDQRGLWASSHFEHHVNTPRNRYLHETLRRVGPTLALWRPLSGRAGDLAREAASLARALAHLGVDERTPAGYRVDSEVFGQHDALDVRALRLARMFRDLAIPAHSDGTVAVEAFVRDEIRMRRLFEDAVFGILHHRLLKGDWSVERRKHLSWDVESASPGAMDLLPGMRLDVRVTHRRTGARWIIDTKYTEIAREGQHGQRRFSSAHVYQIYAYVRSQEVASDAPSLRTGGVLLYPAVGATVDEWVQVQGHRFRFVTVDLAASATEMLRQVVVAATGAGEWAVPSTDG